MCLCQRSRERATETDQGKTVDQRREGPGYDPNHADKRTVEKRPGNPKDIFL